MVRIGKWHEKKILFSGTGHKHTGGTDGSTLDSLDALTCVVSGATTFGDASGDININTGLTSVERAWLNVLGATAAWVSATTGATITAHPNATAGDFWFFARGYV